MNLTLLLIHWENSQYFRLCLVECKIFSKCKIFSGENIFGKGKYFVSVWFCSWKFSKKTYFYHVSHIFLGSKQILLQRIKIYKQSKKQKSKQKKIKIPKSIMREGLKWQRERDRNKWCYVTMRNGLAEWVVHKVSSGVGCSWQSDWLRGGSFTGSMTMKNRSVEWDGSSFIGVGWIKHSPSRGGDEDGDLTGAIVGSTTRSRSLSLSLSLSLSVWASVSPSFSLSFSLCTSPEMVWSENNNGKYFTPRCPYFTVNTENIFSLTQFSVTTKHPFLQKSISGSGLKPKKTPLS